jgi:hypothetical protein
VAIGRAKGTEKGGGPVVAEVEVGSFLNYDKIWLPTYLFILYRGYVSINILWVERGNSFHRSHPPLGERYYYILLRWNILAKYILLIYITVDNILESFD